MRGTLLAQLQELVAKRDFAGAQSVADALVAASPADANAWLAAAVVSAERGAIDEARSRMQRSFEIAGSQPPANHLLHANVLLDSGDPAGAEAQARKALGGAQGWPPALASLAQSLFAQERLVEALEACEAALRSDSAYPRARAIAAAVLWKRGRSFERASRVMDAIDDYRRSLSIDDSPADKWNDLGNALTNAAMLAEAQDAYREALRRDPTYHQVESNLLINMHYDPSIDAAKMYEAHREWAQRHGWPLYPASPPARRKIGANDRLRIGFISPAFHAGPTAAFVAPLLEHIDRDRFDVHCYHVGVAIDATTERLQAFAPVWRNLATQSDEEIADIVRADALDVLVDLAGHTPGGRLLVLARKPAPVIVTWLDYFDTTGLDTVDCIVGDPVSTPSDGSQRFAERLMLVNPCRLCFAPPDYAPEVAPPPAVRNGYVTFGSFNRLSKLAPPVIELWAEVLKAVPGSRLLLKNGAFADDRLRDRFRGLFAAAGISPDRLELRERSPHAQMLAEYADVDIALDPFPYNGGLTTCEALWMGVPVLALLGSSMISRQSASLLESAGLSRLVCADRGQFISSAASLASDTQGMLELRTHMRHQLAGSALLDPRSFTRHFQDLVRALA